MRERRCIARDAIDRSSIRIADRDDRRRCLELPEQGRDAGVGQWRGDVIRFGFEERRRRWTTEEMLRPIEERHWLEIWWCDGVGNVGHRMQLAPELDHP